MNHDQGLIQKCNEPPPLIEHRSVSRLFFLETLLTVDLESLES